MDYAELGPSLLVTKEGPVRVLTMNRPDDLNSFDGSLHGAMRRVWDMLIDDEDADAVVLTGAGRAFSAGGYLPDFIRNQTDTKARRRDIREAERLATAMIATASQATLPATTKQSAATTLMMLSLMRGYSSSCPNKPNWPGSREGSARPRCLNACEVNSRPRGVRCK